MNYRSQHVLIAASNHIVKRYRMKKTLCIVKRCGAKQGVHDVKWHQFPSDGHRRQIWINIIENAAGFRERRVTVLGDSSFFCGRHFTAECYEGTTSRLRKNSGDAGTSEVEPADWLIFRPLRHCHIRTVRNLASLKYSERLTN